MEKPKLAITIGDPAGVGPEIIAKLLTREDVHSTCEPVIYGDAGILERAIRLIGLDGRETASGVSLCGREVSVVNPLAGPGLSSQNQSPGTKGPHLMMEAVKRAVLDAMSGKVEGVVTCPIQKESIRMAGYDYPGHTEFIQDLTGAGQVVMMLAGERLRVALVTIHMALREALDMITGELIYETVRVVWRDFTDKLGIAEPRIAVAGLNPHAGEKGLFGTEEAVHIRPAVERAQADGINAAGPFPPDTVFTRAYNGEFDVVIAMYHDQGLIPLKLVHFDTGVNVTLGLPIVRTSVDHGTAYDIAWKGVASDSSLQSAVRFALDMLAGEKRGDR